MDKSIVSPFLTHGVDMASDKQEIITSPATGQLDK